MPAFRYGALLLLLWTLTSSALAGNAPVLRFCYEDVAQVPWTRPDGSGLNLDLLRRVQARLGEHFEFVPKPWIRCNEEAKLGKMDGIFAASDSAERRNYFAFPTMPNGHADTEAVLYNEVVNIYYKKGSGASWDGKSLVVPHDHPVLAQRGYHTALVLREQGFKVSEDVKTAEEGLRMLSQGMFDVAALRGQLAESLRANDPRFNAEVSQGATPFLIIPLYLVISRKTYERDPKRIQAIWNAIRQERETPEYLKVEGAALKQFGKPQ